MEIVKSGLILLLLVFVLSFTVSVTNVDAQTVHALLIIMDADLSIGKHVKVDKERVQQLLNAVQNELVEVKTTYLLSSKKMATRDNVLQWVRNVNVATDDIVFIYYSGHGAMNPQGQTYLATERKRLFRSDLVHTIEQVKSHRLTLLITDCCSSLAPIKDGPTLQSSRSMTRLTERILRNLFFEHKGFLHVTGATEGEYGWSNPLNGGWFTRHFIEALDSNPDENRDSFLSWEEVFETARKNTQKTFRQARFTNAQQKDLRKKGITSQTPKAYSFPTPLNSFSTPLGGSSKERKTLNYIFLAIVLCSLFISNRISRSLKRQSANRQRISSHRWKVFGVIVIEVLLWIGFNVFWGFFRTHWIIISIISFLLICRILTRKRKQYA